MRALIWLRWKQLVGTANYWLRLVDYDARDRDFMNQAYGLYLVIFMLWWTAAMWAIAANTVIDIGKALPPSAGESFLQYGPPLLFVGQVALAVLALRSSPLKLSLPDISYVAGSTVQRAVPTALGFVGTVAPLTVPVAAGVSFVSLALAQATGDADVAGRAGLYSAIGAVPLVVLAWGVAWLVGLARMVLPGARRLRGAWLLPLLALPLLAVAPETVTIPARALALAMLGRQPGLDWAAPFAIAAAAAAVGVAWLGRSVNMMDVADESALYAQLKEIGNLRWLAPSAYRRAKRQMQSATRRAILRLPEAQGMWALAARSALAYVRDPLAVLKLGLAVAVVHSAVVLLAYQMPALLIVVWLWAAAMLPTGSLVQVFSADVDDPFLRQFLGVDTLRLLAADAALPVGLVIAVNLILWTIQPVPPEVWLPGIALIVLLSILLALCRGASQVHISLGHARVSYGVLAVICFGLSVGVGLLMGSMGIALGIGLLAAAVLASLVKGSNVA
jgi:hypothetical protein